jgi:uncharacterized protein (TIGR00251 family)
MPDWLKPSPEGTLLTLQVQPRASKNEIVGEQGAALRVRLTSPPVEGAANKLCCEFFAKLCGVPKRSVTLQSGEKSRHKRLLITGLDVLSVQAALEKMFKQT